jgi:hypothetical protein
MIAILAYLIFIISALFYGMTNNGDKAYVDTGICEESVCIYKIIDHNMQTCNLVLIDKPVLSIGETIYLDSIRDDICILLNKDDRNWSFYSMIITLCIGTGLVCIALIMSNVEFKDPLEGFTDMECGMEEVEEMGEVDKADKADERTILKVESMPLYGIQYTPI